MKTIILAAGKGSRLGDTQLPKPLTPLKTGKSILAHQLENLSHIISLEDVILVVGYKKEKIMEQFPDLLFVFNPNFSTENTSKSLLRALQKIQEDVLWLNGDVVFHPEILPSVIQSKKSCMVVNEGPVGDEEVKYLSDRKGRITAISKQVENAHGEALGINFFKSKDIRLLKQMLDLCDPSDYFEKGIELAIQEGLKVYCSKVNASLCTEIDFPEDLLRANQLIKKIH